MIIFGAGLSKTGTASLTAALRLLGIDTLHFDTRFTALLRQAGHTGFLDLSIYDATPCIVDIPTCSFYREFLQRYPDLKVILTVREPDRWLNSILDNFSRLPCITQAPDGSGWRYPETTWQGRAIADGLPTPNRFLLLKRYAEHNAAVQAFVPPGQLLTMDIEAGDGWERLCPFLDQPTPDIPFPHRHKREDAT